VISADRLQLISDALDIVRKHVLWTVPHTMAQLGYPEARHGQLDPADAHLSEAADPMLRDAFEPPTAALTVGGQARPGSISQNSPCRGSDGPAISKSSPTRTELAARRFGEQRGRAHLPRSERVWLGVGQQQRIADLTRRDGSQ